MRRLQIVCLRPARCLPPLSVSHRPPETSVAAVSHHYVVLLVPREGVFEDTQNSQYNE